MIAAIVDPRSINLGDVEEVLHHLGVLKSLILDLRQGGQINFIGILSRCNRSQEQGHGEDGGQPEVKQVQSVSPFASETGRHKFGLVSWVCHCTAPVSSSL